MLAVAREQTRNVPNVTVETCDALNPHYATGSFDIALCTLALHHFSPDDATQILRSMARVGKRVMVFDLARARLAYLGALAMTRGLRMDPITRFDAPASVRRAYTVAELRALADQAGLRGAHISMRFPFRLALDAPGAPTRGDAANG
jgi:SAM-dependent methyltransferase